VKDLTFTDSVVGETDEAVSSSNAQSDAELKEHVNRSEHVTQCTVFTG